MGNCACADDFEITATAGTVRTAVQCGYGCSLSCTIAKNGSGETEMWDMHIAQIVLKEFVC